MKTFSGRPFPVRDPRIQSVVRFGSLARGDAGQDQITIFSCS